MNQTKLLQRLLPGALLLISVGLGLVIKPDWWWFGWWSVGLVMGYSLQLIDKWLQPFYDHDDELAGQAISLLEQRKLVAYWSLAQHQQGQLISESVLLWLVFAVLGLLLTTITVGPVSHGLVMGWGANLVGSVLSVYSRSQAEFESRFLWQIKRQLTLGEQRWLVVSLVGTYAVMLFLVGT